MSDDPFRDDPYRTPPYRDTRGPEELFRHCPRCDDERTWPEVMLRALAWLDETMSPDEREERARHDAERAGLDGDRS